MHHMIRTTSFAAAFALMAQPGISGTEAPILTLTGNLPDGPVTLSRDDLKDFPQHEIRTSTTVTDGTPLFEGFLMRDLLDTLGAEGSTITARALNDYLMEIPREDFETYDVIGALYMDGEELTARDKGPVWIVYPRDDHTDLQDIRYDTRWVWQLVEMHIE